MGQQLNLVGSGAERLHAVGRSGSTRVHLLRRAFGPHAAALCGTLGVKGDAWRSRAAGQLCNACHAEACRFLSRVEWKAPRPKKTKGRP